jgi:hypothetical protein
MRKTAFLIAIAVLILGTAAMAANQFGVADTRPVTFYDTVRVGDTLLPAGEPAGRGAVRIGSEPCHSEASCRRIISYNDIIERVYLLATKRAVSDGSFLQESQARCMTPRPGGCGCSTRCQLLGTSCNGANLRQG